MIQKSLNFLSLESGEVDLDSFMDFCCLQNGLIVGSLKEVRFRHLIEENCRSIESIKC